MISNENQKFKALVHKDKYHRSTSYLHRRLPGYSCFPDLRVIDIIEVRILVCKRLQADIPLDPGSFLSRIRIIIVN
ncbi:MAG: hypothetical protein ACYSR9_05355, partial [Planctomycetota bacterium]